VLSIAFLHNNHNIPAYTGAAMETGGINGTESSVIHLAEALVSRGHRVFALNRLNTPSVFAGVQWLPLGSKAALPLLDAAISINSTRLFHGLKVRSKINWLHNPPTLKQQLKYRNLGALLRYRPRAVLLGDYHSKLLHSWLPYSGRSIIFHGIGEEFFVRSPEEAPRAQRAIFTSQPKRGLDFVAGLWSSIRARAPLAELHVFCPQSKEREAACAYGGKPGIVIRGSVTQAALAQELRQARVMLIPGVTDETFCLAAAEATASGVPLITRGIGALSERVQHDETGFICPDPDGFVENAVRLLTGDDLWTRMHARCVANPALVTWDKRAAQWEALLKKLGH
jgi:glycosyltransferase involved in cell wall biosynthesis